MNSFVYAVRVIETNVISTTFMHEAAAKTAAEEINFGIGLDLHADPYGGYETEYVEVIKLPLTCGK